MAKRFTDTQKFEDKWYRKLSLLHKVIWEYLLAECNHAGILEKFDLDILSFKIGAPVTLDDIKSFGDRIVFVSDEILFIPKFIIFQYDNKLNPKNAVHASVLRLLEKYNLEAPCMVLESPFEGSKDKDKNKDKDIQEEDRVQGEGEENSSRFVAEYERVFGVAPVLSSAQKEKLDEIVSSFMDFWEFLPSLLQSLKTKTFNFRDGTTRKADLGWLFKNNNFYDMANEANQKNTRKKQIKQTGSSFGQACFIVQGIYRPELYEYEGDMSDDALFGYKAQAIHWWPGGRLDCPNKEWLEGV